MSDIQQRFEDAIRTVSGSDRIRAGIGTLGEKTLHAVLKYTFEPDSDKHEIKIGTFYADIANSSGIIEIQTRSFNALRKKLAHFLQENTVTVVYPVPHTKWLTWLDPSTGEMTKKRRSPKTGTVYDAFYELYKIKPLLTHPGLTICVVLVDVTDYRFLNGWSRDKKRGSSRCERIPEKLVGTIYLENVQDYISLVPDCLSGEFTSGDFCKAAGISLSRAQTALNVLAHTGAVVRTGKRGKSILYMRAE